MILYQAAFLGGREPQIYQHTRNRLIAFSEWGKPAFEDDFGFWLDSRRTEKKVFLDSGAFSAFTQGRKIDLDALIDFIHVHESELEIYAGLDVIGDHDATMKNVQRMIDDGLDPVPTFHFGSDLAALDEMCQAFGYIALGGLVPLSGSNKLHHWLDQCFRVIRRHWPVKIHLFGITGQSTLERYPAFSADSTAAIVGGGLGKVFRFDRGRLTGDNWKDFRRNGTALGVETGSGSKHMERRLSNLDAFRAFESYLTDLWTTRGIEYE